MLPDKEICGTQLNHKKTIKIATTHLFFVVKPFKLELPALNTKCGLIRISYFRIPNAYMYASKILFGVILNKALGFILGSKQLHFKSRANLFSSLLPHELK